MLNDLNYVISIIRKPKKQRRMMDVMMLAQETIELPFFQNYIQEGNAGTLIIIIYSRGAFKMLPYNGI